MLLPILFLFISSASPTSSTIIYSNPHPYALNITTTSGNHTFILHDNDNVSTILSNFQSNNNITQSEINQLNQLIHNRFFNLTSNRRLLSIAYTLIESNPSLAYNHFRSVANDIRSGPILTAEAIVGASVSLRDNFQLKDALIEAEKALSIDHDFAPARNQMGIINFELHNYNVALAHFQSALKTITMDHRLELMLNIGRCVTWSPTLTWNKIKFNFLNLLNWNKNTPDLDFIKQVYRFTIDGWSAKELQIQQNEQHQMTRMNEPNKIRLNQQDQIILAQGAAVAIATQCHKSIICLQARNEADDLIRKWVNKQHQTNNRKTKHDTFHLIIELWQPKNSHRFHELVNTLRWNLSVQSIHYISVVVATKQLFQTIQQLLSDHPNLYKLQSFVIGDSQRSNVSTLLDLSLSKRRDGNLTRYGSSLDRTNKFKEDVGIIVSNADIAFVATTLRRPSEGVVFALSRREKEYTKNGTQKHYQWNLKMRTDQQDAWIFSSIRDVQQKKGVLFSLLDIPLGKLGVDGRIAQVLRHVGFDVKNPALSIKINHMHAVLQSRTYSVNDGVKLFDRSNLTSASVLLCV